MRLSCLADTRHLCIFRIGKRCRFFGKKRVYMIESSLEKIGLTRGEVKVYLTLLKTGQTTTGKIIDESQLSSGKIYEILDRLIRKGLASFVIKDKTKYFEAASPKMILQHIKDKEEELKRNEQKIESLLPDLIKIQKSKKEAYKT